MSLTRLGGGPLKAGHFAPLRGHIPTLEITMSRYSVFM
jgi:hypothetical protein